tara:strand:- start:290 stop:484 length:195 start_codon:yes stop_codon:yes gene_type:complete
MYFLKDLINNKIVKRLRKEKNLFIIMFFHLNSLMERVNKLIGPYGYIIINIKNKCTHRVDATKG